MTAAAGRPLPLGTVADLLLRPGVASFEQSARLADHPRTQGLGGGVRLQASPLTTPVRRRRASAHDFATISRRYVTLLALSDLVTAGVTSALVTSLVSSRHLWVGLLTSLAWPVLIGLSGGYRRRQIGIGTRELQSVLRGGAVLVLLGAYAAVATSRVDLLTALALEAPAFVVHSLILRLAARKVLHRLQARGIGSRRTLLVGPPHAVADLRTALRREPHSGVHPIAACVTRGLTDVAIGLPVLGNLKQVRTVVERGGFDAVAVAGGKCLEGDYLRRLAWSLEGSGTELLVAPGLAEVVPSRLDIRPVVGMPLLHVQQPSFTGWRFGVKRALDIALTSAGLLVLSPLLVAVALAIKLGDGGPAFFRQARIGRGGRPFEMLKFRSMVVDAEARKAALMPLNEAEGGLFKLSDDPRVTRLGRFIRAWSIDELPQLFNVLAGSMSLVGPRPHLADELAAMPPDASTRRALVTPGLTGLWQISGRSDLPGSEGVRLDLRYVENWSISLDLHIIWKTFRAVLARSGAR